MTALVRAWSPSSIVSVSDEDGQGLAEYALILALIAIVAIVALIFLGSQISDKLSIIGSTRLVTRSGTDRAIARPVDDRRAGRPVPRMTRRVRRGSSDSATLQATLRHARIPAVSSQWS